MWYILAEYSIIGTLCYIIVVVVGYEVLETLCSRELLSSVRGGRLKLTFQHQEICGLGQLRGVTQHHKFFLIVQPMKANHDHGTLCCKLRQSKQEGRMDSFAILPNCGIFAEIMPCESVLRPCVAEKVAPTTAFLFELLVPLQLCWKEPLSPREPL